MRSQTDRDTMIRRVAGNMSSFDTLEECVKQATKEGYIKSAHELGQFRTGYALGVLTDVLRDLQMFPRYMTRAEIKLLTEKLIAVDDSFRAAWGWKDYKQEDLDLRKRFKK